MKEYLYIAGDKIKIWSNNLAVKLEAVRQNQDEILKVKDSVTEVIKESGDVAKSIQKTADNLADYDPDKIREIGDIDGIKKFVGELKETKKVADGSIAKFKKHIENVEKTDKKLEEVSDEIDQSEKAIGELYELDKDVEKVKTDAEKYINEGLLDEKDQTASKAKNTNPEETTEECPLKKCTIDLITIEDNSGRMLPFDNNPAEDEKKKSDSAPDKDAGKKPEKKDPPPPTTLYVICGEKEGYTEEITIKSYGECKSGSACPVVSMDGGSVSETKPKELQKIKLKSEKIIPDQSWADFLRKIIVPDMKQLAKPVIYEVNVHDCDKKDDISDLKIISFPPAGWKGEAAVQYTEKSDEDKKKIREANKETDFESTESMGEWIIGGKISCYLDKEKWDYTPPDEFLKPVQECMNKITPLFTEIDNDNVKIKIGWPNIKLSGNVDLAEVPDHHQLSYKGEINLTAKPFLGVDIGVDIKKIIQRILKTTSPFGVFLTEIMDIAEKGVGNKYIGGEASINVMLEAKAEINGDLQWKREASEGKWSADKEKSSMGGSMSITIYGKVEVKGHAFSVKAAAGAAIHLKSYDGKEASKFAIMWAAIEGIENPSLERQMSFNGLAIYYSAYAQAGTDETATGKATAKLIKALLAKEPEQNESALPSRGGATDEASDESITETGKLLDKGSKELKELCKLMKPWKSTDESTEIGKDTV